MAKLTENQKRFVDEYLIDLNATRAYKVAYPKVKSDETAASAAVRLLRNVKVQEYLKERQKALQERTEITQDRVLLELAKIAFSNGADFAQVVTKPFKKRIYDHDEEGYIEKEVYEQFVEIKDTASLPDDKKAAIASIKETRYGIAIESCDKVKALELIGKHLGMFKDKVEISGQLNNPMEGLTTEELKKLIYDE